MATLRRMLRLIGLTGVAVFGLLAVLLVSALPDEVSRNSTLVESFSSAASWIDDFNKANGRLPYTYEYSSWTASKPEVVYGIRSVELVTPSTSAEFYREAIAALGEPNTSNSYVLSIWTGEENEYYASWVNKSTVDNSSRYYGQILLLAVCFIAAAFVCWYVAHRCRPTTNSGRIPPMQPRLH